MEDKTHKLNFLISGAALSGNKGAMAMAWVTVEQLRLMYPDCQIALLSKYPAQDKAACEKIGVKLVPASPGKLVSVTALRSLLSCFLRTFLSVSWLYDSILKAYCQADLILDIGGITFSDDRDWRGRALSVGWLLPAAAVRKPVIKLSQAIGPFQRFSTRFWAKRLLNRCPILITRGRGSEQNVHQLLPGKSQIYRHDDVAFLLESASDETVKAYLAQQQIPLGGYIGISPSAVIDRKARKQGIRSEYHESLIGLMKHIRRTRNLPVVMIPHAWPQSGRGREDMELCLEFYREMGEPQGVFVVQDDLDCRMLKGIIAQSDVFIGCRFHSMIAAVSSLVPTMVIGWGHKYNEIMERFDLRSFSADFTQNDVLLLCGNFDDLYDHRQEYKKSMTEKLPEILNSARQNYQLVRGYIDQNIVQ
ncbi:MAG: polysaccharide pyruvyl transferase family protein [Phycisphaerae bacterium]|nr:polysaccharide pyruvyl transferase family protein [Phycisphaerae bacterium]